MTDRRTRLAVLGAPISHSLSPALHRAAYDVLGRPWTYEAMELTADRLPSFVSGLDDGWRGLSLTMPLKRDILPLLDCEDDLVGITGSANTVLIDAAGRSGFNTDVSGIVEALDGASAEHVQILGAGATAASAVVASARLGARSVQVSARSPERAGGLREVADRVGVRLGIAALTDPAAVVPDIVISTLPGGASVDLEFSDTVVAHSTLLEVAYDPWPGPLASRWMRAGGRVVPGVEMLVSQALAQVRVFVGGDPEAELDAEPEVHAAMRAAIGLSPR